MRSSFAIICRNRIWALPLIFGIVANLSAQQAYRTPIEPEPPAEPPSQGLSASPSELKKLPLEELVDVQITSASRRAEPLSQAASAVDVITSEDILRSGVTNIPDALRLGTEMEVAQVDGHTWAISARGFNTTAANKMQVLMDGRSLYTPLYSGVFWDVQQTFLLDIAQIEIIRGPGATLWGANAINGVINIRTKTAQETQGLLLYGGAGNEETGFGGLRYGGNAGANTYYRVYVMHQSRDSLPLEGGGDGQDDTHITQGGFRIDSKIHPEDLLTLQGDVYGGTFGQLNAGNVDVDGENVIGRWTHSLGDDSSLTLQTYYDRTHRFVPGIFEEERNTFDLDLQHQFSWGQHDIVYGGNYRLSHDNIGNLGPQLAFIPDVVTSHLLSVYAHDEWHIIPHVFSLTAGSKFEYNSFSGFEIQPTGRFSWLPVEGQTIWGAISRAVRTPSQIDQDLVAPNPSTGFPALLQKNPDFESEELIAYELGYRIKPLNSLSFDLAGYYNVYDNLRSAEFLPNGTFILQNKLNAESYGGALAAKWRATDWWQLDGSVSLFQIDFSRDAGSTDTSNGHGEANDPNCSFLIHSGVDLPWHVQFDSFLRYVGDLPMQATATPAYVTLDLRVAWSPIKNVEIAIVGRNLLDDSHPEFRTTLVTREIPRSVYGTFRWSF